MAKKKLFEKLSFDWTEDSIRLFVTPTQLSKSLPYFIQEVGDFKTFYPYYTERTNLKSYQLIYTLQGEGQLEFLNKRFTIVPGQLFLLDCTVNHRYYTEKGKTWDFLWIHFWGAGAKAFFKELIRDGFQVFNVNNHFQIESSMRRVLALNQKRLLGYDVMSSHLIDSLLTELLLYQLAINQPSMIMPKDIEDVINDIEENFKEELTLDILAHRHGISKFYLSHKFKTNTRTTVNEYLINTRLNFAKELLRTTEQTVTQITYEIGMNNVTHFINLFKSREGLTPLAYRKVWLSGSKKDYGYVNIL